jgi:ATP phosphoribosyltransferase
MMIASKKVAADPRVTQIKRRMEGILVARRYSVLEYNIEEKNLKLAEAITPGYVSPTIPGWMKRAGLR